MAKKDTATSGSQEQGQAVQTRVTAASTDTPAAEGAPKQHEVNQSGFYIYIGPNIRGLIQNGTIYRGTRAEAQAKAAPAIEKFKAVKSLIVSGDALPVARLKLKEPGNAFSVNYRKLTDAVKEMYAAQASAAGKE